MLNKLKNLQASISLNSKLLNIWNAGKKLSFQVTNLTYNEVCIIVYQGLKNVYAFFVKIKTKIFYWRPRPGLCISRPRSPFLSARSLETKTQSLKITHLCLYCISYFFFIGVEGYYVWNCDGRISSNRCSWDIDESLQSRCICIETCWVIVETVGNTARILFHTCSM